VLDQFRLVHESTPSLNDIAMDPFYG
jgi:hypothetical protein